MWLVALERRVADALEGTAPFDVALDDLQKVALELGASEFGNAFRLRIDALKGTDGDKRPKRPALLTLPAFLRSASKCILHRQ